MSKILAQGMITLTQLYEGAQVILTPSAVLIPCDSQEAPKPNAYINAFTNVRAFLGTMDITSKITLGTLEYSDSTVRASKTGTKVSITTITTRTGYVDIPVSVAIDGETIDLGKHRFSFVKQIDGQTGQTGAQGAPGFSYTLNIKGGTRGVAYAANGTNPEPKTSSQFSVELLKNGVKVANPASISWTCGGNLSGSSSTATFTPTIKSTYNSESSYVKVSVKEFAASLAVEETIPVICTKHADGLDWINEWNNQYVQVGTEKIITPKIFAGTKNNANELTGVAIGRDVLGGNANKVIGIVGYKNNTPVFSLDQDANFFVSSSGSAGDIKNGTNNAKGIYFDGNNLYVSGRVRISGGSTIGENNTSVEDVINNSNLGVQANNKLNNLSIGGRNLIRKADLGQNNSTATYDGATNTWTVNATAGAGGTWGCGLVVKNKNALVPYGKAYVLSFEIKVPRACSWNCDVNNYALTGSSWSGNDNDNVSKRSTSSKSLVANQWIKCWIKWENTNPNNTNKVDIYDNSNFGVVMKDETSNMTYQIRNVKGELGNVPTEWTPAPEDIDSAINDKANAAEVYKKTETYSKTQTDSAIEVAKNEINLGISSTYETKTNVESKISSANTTTLNSAKSYADTKKSEAITQAGKDADSKVNSAKNELNTKINNLQVGGRNLVLNGAFINGTSNWNSGVVLDNTITYKGNKTAKISQSGVTENKWVGIQQYGIDNRLIEGETYTIGAMYYVPDKSTLDSSIGLEIKGVKTGAGHEVLCATRINASDITNGKWFKLEKTFTAKGLSNYSAIYFYTWVQKNGTFYVTNCQMCQGNKLGEWTPAPEDVDFAINKKANSTDVYTKTEVYTKAETNSQINIAKDQINLGVSNTYETKANVETKVSSTLNSAKSYADTKKNEAINSAASDAANKVNSAKNELNTKINDIQVGGRNLWIEKNLISAYESSGNATSSTSQHKMMNTYTDLNGAKYVTVQLWNPNSFNNTSNTNRIAFYDSNKTWISSVGTPKPNGTTYVSGIITVPTNAKYMKIGMVTGVSQHESSVKIKVELGNKATGWSPAPEDVTADIANAKTEAINSANSTLTTTIANYYTKEQTNSQINIAKEAINLGVSNTYETKANVETKVSSTLNSAKSYADTKKSEAISSASSDATTKANNALNNAKSYADTKKTEAINTAATDATDKVNSAKSELNGKIDNIQIGGRNLLPKKSLNLSNGASGTFDSKTNTWTLVASKGSSNWGRGLSISSPNSIVIPFGQCATYSFEIKVPKAISWNFDVNNTPVSGSAWTNNDNDNTGARKTSNKSLTKVNEWIKCWAYVENTSTSNTNKVDIKDANSNFGIVTTNETSDITYYIRNVKVELGNKATDWSPCPEDIQNSIDTKANSVDVYTKSQVYTKEETNSQINIAKDNINLGISNTYETKANVESKVTTTLNSAKSYADTKKQEAISTASTDAANKVNSAKNELNTKINDIQVGGRNLFLNSGFTKGLNYWYTYNCSNPQAVADSSALSGYAVKFTSTGGGIYQRKGGASNNPTNYPNGSVMTVSGYVKSSVANKVLRPNFENAGTNTSKNITCTNANTWYYFTHTYKIASNGFSTVTFYGDSGADYYLKDVILEYGNKASTWTPAPEDTTADINTAKNEAINSANSTLTTTIANYYTKAQTDSQINVAKDAINLGVSNTYETKTNVETKISNIQIGGTNLVKNSPTLNNTYSQLNTYKGTRTFVDDTTAKCGKHIKFECTAAGTGFYVNVWSGDDSCIGKKYTWSFYAKMNKAKTLNSIGHERGGMKNIAVTTEWQKFTHTWTYSSSGNRAFVFYPNFAVGDIFYIRDFKIEEGTRATDWTPCPSDVDKAISTAKTEAINTASTDATNKVNSAKNELNTAIGKKANSADVYTKSETYTKAQTDSAIKVAKDEINLGVSNTYETKTNVETKVNNAVNNIQVGGRNLALKTSNNYSTAYSNFNGSTNTCPALAKVLTDGLKVGDTVTVRLLYKYTNIVATSGQTAKCWIQGNGNVTVWNSGAFHGSPQKAISGSGEHEFKYSFTVIADHLKNEFWSTSIRHDYVQSGSVQWKLLKIEKGNKATDWTPAPEDISDSINSKANSSDVYKKTEVYTKSETNSQINVAKDNITSSVSQNYLSKSDATNTYATKSSLTQTANSITAKFEASGGYNLIKNSSGVCQSTSMWSNTAGTTLSYGVNTDIGSGVSQYLFLDNGTNTSEKFAFSSRFKLRPNTKYTLTGYFHNYTKCTSFDVHVLMSTNVDETNTSVGFTNSALLISAQNTGGAWKKYKATFTTPASVMSGLLRIDNNGYNANGSGSNRVHWNALMLVEGELEMPWSPHPDEVYNGSTVIDATGLTVNNGAIKVKNKAGNTVLSGDSNGNLTLSGTIKSEAGNGLYAALNSGGITFRDSQKSEEVLRIGTSFSNGNRDINGVTFAMPQYSDRISFRHIAKPSLENGWNGSETTYTFMEMWSNDYNHSNGKNYKGINVFAPMYLSQKIRFRNGGDQYLHEVTPNITWNNMEKLMGVYGDNGTVIGYKSADNLHSRIVVTEANHPNTGDSIRSWGNWNCTGATVHNATFNGRHVNSYTNTETRTICNTAAVMTEGNQVRVNFENVQIKDGKAILSIPKRYRGINEGYIIASIVKKGRGDVWVSEEEEERFIIEAENDIKINIEVIIKLTEAVVARTLKHEDSICYEVPNEQPEGDCC